VVTEAGTDSEWVAEFGIQSLVDLDFVIGQQSGLPIGMTRRSPPELRRRVLAAASSYLLQLSSIDYTLKRYVRAEQYEDAKDCLGDRASDFLAESAISLKPELKKLHTQEGITFGQFGAEITLFRVPEVFDTARMLANRGLLLEVLPLLRLAFEMTAWSNVAFYLEGENNVRELQAQSCISKLKLTYSSAGEIYGHLSELSHWRHVVHSQFLHLNEEHVAILHASCRYRAMSLMLCLLVLDVFIEVIRHIYSSRADNLIATVQTVLSRDDFRKSHQMAAQIMKFSKHDDFKDVYSLLR
jgi:hypothetical protein